MWLADRLNADILDLKDAKKKEKDFYNDYQAIIYGGWAMAGNIVKLKWFLENASTWKDKRLAVFCVGGSPNDNPDVVAFLQKALTDEQKKILFDLARGNALGARQINDFAVILEEIEFALPVIAHNKNIDIVLHNVVDLLFPGVLRQNLVHIFNSLKDLFAVLKAVISFFALDRVELVG